MIDESLLKSNFLGRDGFRWWIGQVAPIESQGKQANGGGWGNRVKVRILGYHPYNEQELPNKDLPWAQVLLPTTSGSGAGGCATSTKLKPSDIVFGFFLDGDNAQIPVVVGCFGRTSDIPTGDKPYVSPFTPFTGYTNRIKKPSGTLKGDETNESNTASQKSPRDVPPNVINNLNKENKKSGEVPYFTGIGKTVVFGNTCSDTALAGTSAEIDNLLQKLKSGYDSVNNVSLEINRSVEKITGIMNTYVGKMMNSLYYELIPTLQEGLRLLYELVYAAVLAATGNERIAHLAGVAAQTAMIQPVKELEDGLHTIGGKVVSNLKDPVRELLTNVVDKVDNLVSCASNQFSGAILNSTIDSLLGSMGPILDGVGRLLSLVGFDPETFLRGGYAENSLRQATSSIQTIGGMFDSNQSQNKCSGISKKWVIGKGVIDPGSEQKLYNDILKNMNVAIKIGRGVKERDATPTDNVIVDNFLSFTRIARRTSPSDNVIFLQNLDNITSGSLLSFDNEIMRVNSVNQTNSSVNVDRAVTGITTNYKLGDRLSVIRPISKKKLKIIEQSSEFDQKYGTWDIFGGKPAVSNTPCYVGPPIKSGPPKVRIFGGGGKGAKGKAIMGSIVTGSSGKTGSVIGIEIENGGNDYRYPPYIEITDEYKQGYGAVGRVIIDDSGKVTDVYMVSTGENYPVVDTNVQVGAGASDQQDSYGVYNVIVLSGGLDYSNSDIVYDDLGNNYKLTVDNGSIVSVQVINTRRIQELPIITIESDTGTGAILKPVIGKLDSTLRSTAKLTRIVDCPT